MDYATPRPQVGINNNASAPLILARAVVWLLVIPGLFATELWLAKALLDAVVPE